MATRGRIKGNFFSLRGIEEFFVGIGRCITGSSASTGLSINLALRASLKGTLCTFDPIYLLGAMLFVSFGRNTPARPIHHILEDQNNPMDSLGDPLALGFWALPEHPVADTGSSGNIGTSGMDTGTSGAHQRA